MLRIIAGAALPPGALPRVRPSLMWGRGMWLVSRRDSLTP
jgi:hypothetical protein